MQHVGPWTDEQNIVSIKGGQTVTVVMLTDIAGALASLLADLPKIEQFVPQAPNYIAWLYELRKEMFGY